MCQSSNEYIELICQTMPTNHMGSMHLRINGKYYVIDLFKAAVTTVLYLMFDFAVLTFRS